MRKYVYSKTVQGWFAAIGVAVMLLMSFEGKSNVPYFPVPGDALTICYGETHGVKPTDWYSDKQCLEKLQKRAEQFAFRVDSLVKTDISYNTRAALISFMYNVGETQFRKSTLLRKLNSGDVVGACNELPRWVYFKGRKLNGLIKRREIEREYCLKGE